MYIQDYYHLTLHLGTLVICFLLFHIKIEGKYRLVIGWRGGGAMLGGGGDGYRGGGWTKGILAHSQKILGLPATPSPSPQPPPPPPNTYLPSLPAPLKE